MVKREKRKEKREKRSIMFNYEDIAERFWNLPQKGLEEYNRESNFIDDIILKSHTEREILNNLSGVKTVFDGGAGAGRFSVLLAKMGISVTHFDISDSQINMAKEYAKREGVFDKIQFIKGRLGDLSDFSDSSYDMAISFDSPISYTYPNHEDVIKNLIRIVKDKLLISVSSRLGHLPYYLSPASKMQYLLDKNSEDPLVKWYIEHSRVNYDEYEIDMRPIAEIFETGLLENIDKVKGSYLEGNTPWPVTYLFMPEELKAILESNGAAVMSMAGPGAFSRSIPNEVLVKIMNNERHREEFLNVCYEFDRQPSVVGLGKDNLLAVAKKNRR